MFFKRKDERAIRKQARERAERYKAIQAQAKKYQRLLRLDPYYTDVYYEGALLACHIARTSPDELDELDELEEEIERECAKWRIYRTLLKQLGAKQ